MHSEEAYQNASPRAARIRGLIAMLISASVVCLPCNVWAQRNGAAKTETPLERRIYGMLIGSLIGDAVGGPVEFKSNDELKKWVPNLREWSAEKFRKSLANGKLAEEFRLLPYQGIRDDIAPYGPWEKHAHAGTITDDSRHKIILLQCLRRLLSEPQPDLATSTLRVTPLDLARTYIDYKKSQIQRGRKDYARLTNESMIEYVSVAKWMLGERDLAQAKPPQRLWAGIATCSGQMTLLPLAAVFPNKPDAAYRSAYSLGIVDVGPAKDINSALVAGLSAALGSKRDKVNEASREAEAPDVGANATWQIVFDTMRKTDPYDYESVPFAGRPTTEWISFAEKAVERAAGSPRKLYEILEKEGRAKYYWDAHFTFATSIACLKFADYQPLESILVSLAFGHDTDSAAQVIGAFVGAVYGPEVFPLDVREQVEHRLSVDYGESVTEWTKLLSALSDRETYPHPIQFVEDPRSK